MFDMIWQRYGSSFGENAFAHFSQTQVAPTKSLKTTVKSIFVIIMKLLEGDAALMDS